MIGWMIVAAAASALPTSGSTQAPPALSAGDQAQAEAAFEARAQVKPLAIRGATFDDAAGAELGQILTADDTFATVLIGKSRIKLPLTAFAVTGGGLQAEINAEQLSIYEQAQQRAQQQAQTRATTDAR